MTVARANKIVADLQRVELQPLAPEHGGISSETTTRYVNINLPVFCGCCKFRKGFNEKDESTYSRFVIAKGILTCPDCGRTGRILPKPPAAPPQTKRCWECGREFTYAECKRNSGDWNENGGYCGC
jgi:hypothetical protein